ncbi:MAG: glycosyltransferase family 2 protein, partial [bacterium]
MRFIKKKLQDNLSVSSKLFLRALFANAKRTTSYAVNVPFEFAQRVIEVAAPKLSTRSYSLEPYQLPEIEVVPVASLLAQTVSAALKSEDLKTSIIIPVFNKAEFTLGCINSLLQEINLNETEIIVVDNASTDETPEMLSILGDLVRVIRNEENRGFVDACNQGAAVARGQFLVFLNNDTKVLPGWLDHLLTTIENRRSVGAVGSMFLYPDGSIQEAGAIVWNNGEAHHYGWSALPGDRRF